MDTLMICTRCGKGEYQELTGTNLLVCPVCSSKLIQPMKVYTAEEVADLIKPKPSTIQGEVEEKIYSQSEMDAAINNVTELTQFTGSKQFEEMRAQMENITKENYALKRLQPTVTQQGKEGEEIYSRNEVLKLIVKASNTCPYDLEGAERFLDESPKPSTPQAGEEEDEPLLYFMDWVVKNVWFDNDEYYIKGLGYTTHLAAEILEHFREQHPYNFKSQTSPPAPDKWPSEEAKQKL